MIDGDRLARLREEHEVMDTWRKYSRHVVADLLEACSVCGMVREKDRFNHCRWCEDVYVCKEGLCAQHHQATTHPAVAFWSW